MVIDAKEDNWRVGKEVVMVLVHHSERVVVGHDDDVVGTAYRKFLGKGLDDGV